VVEAKPEYKTPGEGLQQAKGYAEILGLGARLLWTASTWLARDAHQT